MIRYAFYDFEFGILKIGYTDKQVAAAAGNPKASRAVGMANNKTPLMVAIPCHRVVGTDGNLIGYAGGLDMKKALLELERNQIVSGEGR